MASSAGDSRPPSAGASTADGGGSGSDSAPSVAASTAASAAASAAASRSASLAVAVPPDGGDVAAAAATALPASPAPGLTAGGDAMLPGDSAAGTIDDGLGDDSLMTDGEIQVMLGQMEMDMEGQTVLEKPRVKKKTMMAVIKAQTRTLRTVTTRLQKAERRVGKLEFTNKKRDAKINELVEGLQEAQVYISELRGQVKKHTEALQSLSGTSSKTRHKVEAHDRALQNVNLEQQRVLAEVQEQAEVEAKKRDELHRVVDNLIGRVEHTLKTGGGGGGGRGGGGGGGGADPSAILVGPTELPLDEVLDDLFLRLDSVTRKVDDSEGETKTREEAAALTRAQVQSQLEQHSRTIHELSQQAGLSKPKIGIEAMLATCRRSIEESQVALESLQRQMIKKVDATRVDEQIESKYEEIIEHLQSALASTADDEDEFKRVCHELQGSVTSLSRSKADRREVEDIKATVMFDSGLREQVESLRAFIDLKINRDEVMASIKDLPDRQELDRRLNTLSHRLKVSMRRQQAVFTDEAALQTRPMSTPLSPHGGADRNAQGQCLSCATRLANAGNGHDPSIVSFGGGFQVGKSKGDLPFHVDDADLPEMAPDENGMLVGVDGSVYRGTRRPPGIDAPPRTAPGRQGFSGSKHRVAREVGPGTSGRRVLPPVDPYAGGGETVPESVMRGSASGHEAQQGEPTPGLASAVSAPVLPRVTTRPSSRGES